MKEAKCTSCGANIQVDEQKDAGVCPYCNSAYVTEKAIRNYDNSINTTNNAGTIVNNYYTAQPNTQITRNVVTMAPPRPKINVGLAVLGLIFYLFPGIIYIALTVQKQKEWDEKYLGKK